MATVETRTLPTRIMEKAAACVLYGLAVGIAAAGADQPQVAIRAQAISGGRSEATRLLDGMRTAAEDAAFANATLFHARCQEDAHPAGHFGSVVIPATLAMAEAAGASGAEAIAAIVAGYEVALRVGRDHVRVLSGRGFRSTSVYGVFGAAAAAARLRRLDRDRAAHALALAANTAGGLRAFIVVGSDDFPYHAGFAARNGLLAAALADSGAEGPLDALSCEGGFFAAFGEAGRDYASRVASGLGEEFEIEAVTFKPYPTCQFHRAVVGGLIRLRARAEDTAATAIEIRMHPAEAEFWGVRFSGPFHRFSQAFMSAPFCAAVAWARGGVRFRDLHEFDAPDVMALVPRVAVIADATRPPYGPLLTVALADGRSLVSDEAPGGYPLTWESAVTMTRSLAAEVGVPEAVVNSLIRGSEMLVDLPDMRDLIATACVAAHAASQTAQQRVGGT